SAEGELAKTGIGADSAVFSTQGYACLASILCCIGIIVPSMSRTWFIGPIALAVTKPASEYGADLGFELSYAMAFLTYPIFRTLEIHYFKR
ncbi:hypothetical protein JCM3765_003210, partial [Sporobolomyces pararoseus]